MMMHSHLLGPSTSLTGGSSGLQSAAALSEVALLNHSISQTKEELKTFFTTREGTYKIMPQAEYSRPSRAPINQVSENFSQQIPQQPGTPNSQGGPTGATVKVSFLNYTLSRPVSHNRENAEDYVNECDEAYDSQELDYTDLSADRMCFNVGRELYVYSYKGTNTAADLSKPIDKRVYKGTFPTCHQFNPKNATAETCNLLIGFSAGQIQMIDPTHKNYQDSRLYNEDRWVEKTNVTCIRWVPEGDYQHFMVSYASGYMYLFHEDVVCPPSTPIWQLFKQGDKYSIHTCKSKTTRNPLYRWQVGEGTINQFGFSGPDAKFMATVGNDGYLRIFNYHQMELLCYMKSYFGGLLTLSWSPDSRLVATGGEDDLLTVYNVPEKRVVCRGSGHKSWISQVAFDPYTCVLESTDIPDSNGISIPSSSDFVTLDDDINAKSTSYAGGEPGTPTAVLRANNRRPTHHTSLSRCSFASFATINGVQNTGICYRIGSVGHDTQLCLWDITEDMLRPVNVQRHRNSTIMTPMLGLEIQTTTSRLDPLTESSPASSTVEKPKKKKAFHRRGFTLASRLGASSNERRRVDSPSAAAASAALDEARLLGTRICPRMEDVPIIEPLVCKKISHERLTVLEFRKDCMVTACQEGFICTWARPGKLPSNSNLIRRDRGLNSPLASSPPFNRLRDGDAFSTGGHPFWSPSSTS